MLTFDPKQPLADRTVSRKDAFIWPHPEIERAGSAVPHGVYDAERKLIPEAISWRSDVWGVTAFPPEDLALPEPMEHREGRWLFGGILYGHFGHFLCESTSRLWALDHADGKIDGVAFIHKRNVRRRRKQLMPIRPWLAAIGVKIPVELIVNPTSFDEIIVPQQGFGMGKMIEGSPEYRAYARKNFGADIQAAGAERIYISRTKLVPKRGRYLGEAQLETCLEREGYRIFHPQEHSIEDQIAQYKAAKFIISSDNSALHMAAFCVAPATRIAIIMRRSGEIIDLYQNQLKSFTGTRPTVIDALIPNEIYSATPRGNQNEMYTKLSFESLQDQLDEAGFLNSGGLWAFDEDDTIVSEMREMAEKMGLDELYFRGS